MSTFTIQEYKDYQAKWQKFLTDHYKTETLTDLCIKQFKFLYEEAPDFTIDKEAKVQEFLDKIFSQNRLHAMFCVMKHYKKYQAKGFWNLILEGKQFAPTPGEIKKVQIHTSCATDSTMSLR